ncbi:MAG: hypothetical protein D6731_08325 [Planctomycetota bacterium]|nr:MAG: hypothetical protein D6731_08325 [Planctomycetota bacterium]
MVLAQEELSGLFQRRELESADGAGTATDEPPGTVGAPGSISPMEAAVDRVLRSLCLPTRSDVDELRRGVDALAERINSLRD